MSIEFVYFNKDNNSLYKAQAEENIALYRMFLSNHGVEQSQYFNDSLPNIYDIADDLLSEYAEFICFIITKDNVDFSTAIADAVFEADDSIHIIFACKEEVEIPKREYGKVFMPQTVVMDLNQLLGVEDDKEMVECFEVYKNHLFPVKAGTEYGILLNRYFVFYGKEYIASVDSVLSELSYVSKHIPREHVIVLNSEDISKYPYLDELLLKIEEQHFPQKIIIGEKKEKNTKTAFVNGLQFHLLGYYSENLIGDYTKHIEVDKREMNKEFFRSISNHNAGNSAIYGIGDTELDYDEVKEMVKDTGFLFTNYLDFHQKEDFTVTVDINENKSAFEYQQQPYADYKESIVHDSYVSLDRREDFDALISDYRRFVKTGIVDKERMWKPFITERCRFGVNGVCSLTRIQRFRVSDGLVYPCRGCSQDIGTCDVQHFQLLKKACVNKEKEENSRKCNECKARVYCGKCTMLPDYLSTKEYCELVCEDTSIISYFNQMLDAKFIFEYGTIGKYKESQIYDVIFITRENQVIISKYVHGDMDYFDINVVFYKYEKKNAFIGFSLTDRKAFEMNQNMFILCELMYKGLSYNEITAYLHEEYDVSEDDAKKLLEKGLHILNEKGYLKKDIYKYGIL